MCEHWDERSTAASVFPVRKAGRDLQSDKVAGKADRSVLMYTNTTGGLVGNIIIMTFAVVLTTIHPACCV